MANQMVECVACGHVGVAKGKVSILIFIILLFVFFPLAIIYYVVARNNKGCSACKSSNVKLYVPQARNPQHQPQIQQSNVQQIQCPDCREYIRYDARKCKHCGSMVE